MFKVKAITAVIMTGIFGLAACGGGSSDKNDSTTTTVRQRNGTSSSSSSSFYASSMEECIMKGYKWKTMTSYPSSRKYYCYK